MFKIRIATAPLLLAGMLSVPLALAQNRPPDASPEAGFSAATAAEARRIVESARSIVHEMTSDDRLTDLLAQSKGVLILPDVLKGGLVAGGRGGEGVLLSNPAFFDLGAITIGAQAGGAVGPVVMLLMTEEAVRSFTDDDRFAFGASAGLSVFGYDVAHSTDTREGDVIVWSDPGGGFAGAAIGASGFSIDDEKNHAFYRTPAGVEAIFRGEVKNPRQGARPRQTT